MPKNASSLWVRMRRRGYTLVDQLRYYPHFLRFITHAVLYPCDSYWIVYSGLYTCEQYGEILLRFYPILIKYFIELFPTDLSWISTSLRVTDVGGLIWEKPLANTSRHNQDGYDTDTIGKFPVTGGRGRALYPIAALWSREPHPREGPVRTLYPISALWASKPRLHQGSTVSWAPVNQLGATRAWTQISVSVSVSVEYWTNPDLGITSTGGWRVR